MLDEPATATGLARRDLYKRHTDELEQVWEESVGRLPPEAEGEWERGAAYVRESSVNSLHGDSPSIQLRQTLTALASQRVYVPREGVFFEQASGTSIQGRRVFRRLLDEAIAGKFTVVGAYLSDRLFRNSEEAEETERRFRRSGIRLTWLGKLAGDEDRDASLFVANANQRVLDEAIARRTAQHIGLALQDYSARGRPIGQLPEGYRVAERGPEYHGRVGRPLRWEPSEPLASIIAEGARRAVAGETFAQLAEWSAGTPLEGRTPKGHVMDRWWWRGTLTNPRYTGHHRPSEWQGFNPSETPAERWQRRKRRPERPLVPCDRLRCSPSRTGRRS
jgi:DNA invertase Pin-like site-specific DNA recombinase